MPGMGEGEESGEPGCAAHPRRDVVRESIAPPALPSPNSLIN
jgi:hypothetical protein